MQIAIPTQSAAMFRIDQVRRATGTGARSSLLSALNSSINERGVGTVAGSFDRPFCQQPRSQIERLF
jgi:hypothetical protein